MESAEAENALSLDQAVEHDRIEQMDDEELLQMDLALAQSLQEELQVFLHNFNV